jgi:DNA-binding transcriptional regulator YiaG
MLKEYVMRKKRIAKIPTLNESLQTTLGISNDIKIILERENLTRIGLAKSLGVNRRVLYRWEKGICTPEEPLIVLTITSWADWLEQFGNGQSLS